MPISKTDQLFNLVKSLTKSEKRNFKLYVNRHNKDGGSKFIQLFNILDKQDFYNEDRIFKKISGLSKGQLSNLKRHLFTQILTSLRLIHIHKEIDIQIREQIDFARILYGKGLYLQSLKLLGRIEQIADAHHQDYLHMEILEFQKLIESRHITRSRMKKNKMENLIKDSVHRSKISYNASKLANLKLKIHGLYIQLGHIRDDKDRIMVQEFFNSALQEINTKNLTYFEKIYLNQSYVWYYYIMLDFENCHQYATKWVNLFEEEPEIKKMDPDLYMRGIHYQLTCLYNLGYYKDFEQTLRTLEKFVQNETRNFNTTSNLIAFLYLYTSKLNHHFITGTFHEGIKTADEVEKKLKVFDHYLDPHRIMVFYFKIAWMHFGNGDFPTSLDYLNKIIYLDVGVLREDIQAYARIFSLIVHYELNNYQLLEYQIISVTRYLNKLQDPNKMQREILNLVSRILYKPPEIVIREFKKFEKTAITLGKNIPEKKALIYLDIEAWVQSKITGKSLKSVIQSRFKQKLKKKYSLK